MTKKSLYPLLLLALLLLSVFGIPPLLKTGEDKADLFPATVVRISEEYANINTDVDRDDLSARGITHGTVFKVNFRVNNGSDHEAYLKLGDSLREMKQYTYSIQVYNRLKTNIASLPTSPIKERARLWPIYCYFKIYTTS